MDAKMFEKIKRYLRLFPNPVLLVDRNAECVYCNRKNFCRTGTSLLKCFNQPFVIHDNKVDDALLIFKEKSYCARIYPFIDNLFICELFASDTIMKMAERTDIYAKITTLLLSVDNNVSIARDKLESLETRLHKDNQPNYYEYLATMEKSLVKVEMLIKNILEYTNMCLLNSENDVIETRELIADLQSRVNNTLASRGRYIDVFDTMDMFCISANKRHIIIALMNAVQNAVYYSPMDSIPVITLYDEKQEESGDRMVVIQIENDIIVSVDENGKYGYEFDNIHMGLGIPIIKRFAEDAGGKVIIENANGKFRLSVKIPEYRAEIGSTYQFNSSGDIQYTDKELEIIDIFTRDTILFNENYS